MNIDICLSPALFSTYNKNTSATVVVVDIFRATTCMCVAIDNGVKSILPIADIEKAKSLKEEGYLVGAERNVTRCDFADFGNSPFEYMNDKVKGKEIVLTTTNGTQAIELAKVNDTLLIGSFANITVLTEYLSQQNKDLLILCSGWNNAINIEDTLFAGALTEKLMEKNGNVSSDTSILTLNLWKEAKKDIRSFMQQSEHIHRLLKHGLEKDIEFCLQTDTVHSIPVYDKSSAKLIKL